MTKRKPLVTKEEIIKAMEEEYKKYPGFTWANRANWPERYHQLWKETRPTIYARLRRVNRERTSQFWTCTFNNGCLDAVLKKYGLTRWGNTIQFYQGGSVILTDYLNKIVIPALEKELNITGIKPARKRCSGYTKDLLNWENAEIKGGTKETSIEDSN